MGIEALLHSSLCKCKQSLLSVNFDNTIKFETWEEQNVSITFNLFKAIGQGHNVNVLESPQFSRYWSYAILCDMYAHIMKQS